jgi:SpoVK/Ycf46/Vps4 family AAA+-type ATPase
LRFSLRPTPRKRSCFIFIDEFQSIFGSRLAGGATSGLASLLLQLMDAAALAQAPPSRTTAKSRSRSSRTTTNDDGGNGGNDDDDDDGNDDGNDDGGGGGGAGGGGRVVVVAATNSPEAIDSAFLRPGRFDHLVCVSLRCARTTHSNHTRRALPLSSHISLLHFFKKEK